MKNLLKQTAVGVLIPLMAACGGGESGSASTGSNPGSKVMAASVNDPVTTIRIFGDSLSDTGTRIGSPATVKTPFIDTNGAQLPWTTYLAANEVSWPKTVKDYYGFNKNCHSYFEENNYGSISKRVNEVETGCINYAVGGAKLKQNSNNGLSIGYQVNEAKSKILPNDLIIIEGGGNDMYALLDLFLRLPLDGNMKDSTSNYRQSVVDYAKFVRPDINISPLDASLITRNTLKDAGTEYMRQLGNDFGQAIKVNLSSSNRVIVGTVPNVSKTVLFDAMNMKLKSGDILTTLEVSNIQNYTAEWTNAFNNALTSSLQQDVNPSKYTTFDIKQVVDMMTAPPAASEKVNSFGFIINTENNHTITACQSIHIGSCYISELTGDTASYGFSDDFHPSPFGHLWLAESLMRSIKSKNWPVGSWTQRNPVPSDVKRPTTAATTL